MLPGVLVLMLLGGLQSDTSEAVSPKDALGLQPTVVRDSDGRKLAFAFEGLAQVRFFKEGTVSDAGRCKVATDKRLNGGDCGGDYQYMRPVSDNYSCHPSDPEQCQAKLCYASQADECCRACWCGGCATDESC